MSYSLSNKSPLFHLSVDKLLNNWPALQVAVLHGQGGQYGKDIAGWMRGVVEDFFYQNEDLAGFEVAEFLGQIMNQELDTLVEDNSLEELGEQLCLHFRMGMNPTKEQELMQLHQALDAAAASKGPTVQAQAASVESSSSDEDDEMETDEVPPAEAGSSNSIASPPQGHRSGQNFVTDPDEEGWVTVVKSKK